MPRQIPREEYTVGWICALPVELAAAKALIDEKHDDFTRTSTDDDENVYCTGSIAGHNVVIVCLPAGNIGNNPAAAIATQMRATFRGIRFGLMVGIGGGVPSAEADIRLGDIVVGIPHQSYSGVVQYDKGKATPSGFKRTGYLNSPPQILLSAVNAVRANTILGESRLSEHISKLENIPAFRKSRAGPDVLYDITYEHTGGSTCAHCLADRQQTRPEREDTEEIVVHYGTIASGNLVIRTASKRDEISAELGGVLCFEMEAAGLMNTFPCICIRSICDYSDSHKNKKWQAYASAAAAAYAKELLLTIPPADVLRTSPAEEAMKGPNKRGLEPINADSGSSKRTRVDERDYIVNDPSEHSTITLPIHRQNQNQHQSQPTLSKEERANFLESLKFEQIDARRMAIKTAHARTCKWILKNPQYIKWFDATTLDEHNGFLWVKGKAGAGKSTLMNFTIKKVRQTMKASIVIAFFFNARGEELEKSTLGLYRSLLFQLLDRLPYLFNILDISDLSPGSGPGQFNNIELLKEILEQAIVALGQSSVVCFIDALDECEEEQVRDMIQFFERIGDIAVTNGIGFQVCFSSRYYPHVTIRKGLELPLEGQEGHSQDIVNYIEAELKIGKSKTAQNIRLELQEKASGVFMWVVLVVKILNEESDRGQVHLLQQKLREIPANLHKLFQDILMRGGDNKDSPQSHKRLVLCIQWVLFARQPLSPEELYYAIRSGSKEDALTFSPWNSDEITEDVIRLFILDCSKGLAEIVPVGKARRVQFIHESVRDFLLKENGLSEMWPELKTNFEGQSHEELKECCLNYLDTDFASELGVLDDLPKASSKQSIYLRVLAVRKFPFLEYAIHNVLYHANEAEGHGIAQNNFLNDFSLPNWVKLDNLFQKHQIRRHDITVSWQYVLAELNMANLLIMFPLAEECIEVNDERYGCALFAASAMGSVEALELCLRSLNNDHAVDGSLIATFQQKIKRDFSYSVVKGVWFTVVDFGDDAALTLLVKSGLFFIDNIDGYERSTLWWASSDGHENAVKALLDAGSLSVNHKDKDGLAPLSMAALHGHYAIAALLLDKGADVLAQDILYNNALQAAASQGYKEIVVMLLEKGADITAQGGFYGNALQAASYNGYREIVDVLLEHHADVNARGGQYGNALAAASAGGHKQIVDVLLDKGADINAGLGHSSALDAALSNGFQDIAYMLLNRDTDVIAKGRRYGNTLQLAACKGYKEFVVALLDRGVDVNAPGGTYGNTLQAASACGHKDIVDLLINRGADIHAQGGYYGNALQAASYKGEMAIAGMLLDRGANVNTQGGHYGSALQAASSRGYTDVVKLLLRKGARVNAKGGLFGSALNAAKSQKHPEVVDLLLAKGAV